jgi:hypothetical protein
MFERQRQKERVRKWALAADNPNRKAAQQAFPDVPGKVIRQVLQSVKDTNGTSS